MSAFAAKQNRGGTHNAYLGVTTEIDGDLDSHALTRALHRFVLRHTGLRTWFTVDGSTVTRRLAGEAAVDFEVSCAGELTNDEQFQAYARERFSIEATPTSWPGFAFGAVRRPGSFTLYYGCDHSLSDGGSQTLAIVELAELYNAESAGPEGNTAQLPPAGSFLDYAGVERELAASFDVASPEIKSWTDIFTSNGGAMPTFPLDLGLAPGETAPIEPIKIDLLDADQTQAFDLVCKSAGAKIIGGIFAAVAITDFELAKRENYFGITVLSTRALGNFGLSQGWFCNFAPVAFNVSTASSFTEAAAAAQAGYTHAKILSAVPIQTVLAALLASGVAGSEVAASPNMLSYIDFRWFPGAGSPADKHAIQFTGEGETANASMWFNRDAHHLYLGAQTPRTPFAQKQIALYHAHLRNVLTTVARDGDYTITAPRLPELAFARHDD